MNPWMSPLSHRPLFLLSGDKQTNEWLFTLSAAHMPGFRLSFSCEAVKLGPILLANWVGSELILLPEKLNESFGIADLWSPCTVATSFSSVSLSLLGANAYSQPRLNTLHIESLFFQKAPWINWLGLMHTDCSYFNWLLFSNKITRDFCGNTHKHVSTQKHKHTF